MSGKNLKVALQVKADLDQARREIKGLNQDLKDVSQTSLSTSTAQQKVSRTAVLTAAEMQKMSGATNLKAGINQLSDYEIWLKKTSMANLDASRTSQLFENSVRSLTPHLLSLIGISGTFVGIAVDTLNKAAELQNLSNVSGMNVEQFQYYVTGAKKVGVEQEKLADIFKDTRDKVGDFIATGGGEMADFFENIAPKVGVTVEQFKKLNGQEALQLYVDTLQKAGVSQNEMVFYLEAIANDATLLLPLLNQGGESWKKYGDAAQSAGAILGQGTVDEAVKAKQALGDLQTSVSGVTNTLVANAAPAITFVAQNLDVLVKAGLLVASVYAVKMVSSVAAATISFVVGRIEAIRYQMALANMAGVATTTAARLTALSTVSRLLTVAGGLPGLAIAAAGVAASFLLMPSSSDAATESLDQQHKSVAELAEEYRKLDETQQRITMRDAVKQVDDLSEAYRKQYLALAGVVRAVMNNSEVSQKDKDIVKQLYDEYVKGDITANQLATSLSKLGTVNRDLKSRIDEQAKATTEAKNALDKQNLVIDVYSGKVSAAALASDNLSGSFDGVGASADSAATKIGNLGKAYQEYMAKLNSGTLDNLMIAGMMQSGLSDQEARMRQELLNAKNSDPNAKQTYGALTDDEIAKIKISISSEESVTAEKEKQKKQEEAKTKEQEKQKKIAEQTAKVNALVQSQAQKFNYKGLEDKYDLPSGLLAATSMQESKGNRYAKSPVGALGAFQFMPATADRFGLKDRTDVGASAEAAAKYYQFLLKKFNGDLDKAIMAYNAGEGNVASGKAYGFKETQKYLPAVKKYLAGYNGLLDENAQANLTKMLAAENEQQKQQEAAQNNRISLREFYYSEEEKALAEHNKRISDLNKAGYSDSELAVLLEKENQRYEEVISKRPEILKRVQESMSALDESWLRASGEGLEADLKAVEEKWKPSKADIASLMMSESDPLQANRYQEMLVKIDFIIDKEKLTLQFNDAMKQIEDLKAQHEERKNALKLQFESGEVNQFQYAENLRNLEADLRPQFMSLIEMARELALQLDDAFSVQKLDNLAAGMERAQSSTKSFIPTVEQLAERFSDGLTNAIFDWIDGTKSASDAFREFASSFLREIAQMILKQLIFNATQAALGAMGVGFSSGGYTGAGGKYDVAGVVHKDEFVIRKESTSQQGAKEFLNYFNIYGMEALNKFRGYSTGGLVGAPEISMPPNIQTPQLTNPAETIAQSTSFNANQNFYLVDDPKRILDTLNSSQGQENIVVMMSRDPAKFKSALKIG